MRSRVLLLILLGVAVAACASVRLPHKPPMEKSRPVKPPFFKELEYFRAFSGPVIGKEPIFSTDHYEIYHFKIQSVGINGQEGNLVTGQYWRAKDSGSRKFVIVLPIYDVTRIPAESMTLQLTEWNDLHDTNVLIIDGEKDLFDPSGLSQVRTEKEFEEEISQSVLKFTNTVKDIRRILDWAQTRPEISNGKKGIVGFSVSVIAAVMAAAADPRIGASAYVMGGGRLDEIFVGAEVEYIRKTRESVLRNFGWSKKEFQEKLIPLFATIDPVRFARFIDPASVIIFDAAYDIYIPDKSRSDFWEALGYPERITYFSGHKMSFLSTVGVGLYATPRAIAEFFDKKL